MMTAAIRIVIAIRSKEQVLMLIIFLAKKDLVVLYLGKIL